MSVERELKFAATAGEHDAAWLARVLEQAGASIASSRDEALQDLYFDTADRALAAAGWACRIRATGGRATLMLKSAGGMQDALHTREEIVIAVIDAGDAAFHEIAPLVAAHLGHELPGPLHLYGRVNNRRTTIEFAFDDGTRGEASCDDVLITAHGASETFREIEIEFAAATPADAIERVATLFAVLPPSALSKAGRLEALRRRVLGLTP